MIRASTIGVALTYAGALTCLVGIAGSRFDGNHTDAYLKAIVGGFAALAVGAPLGEIAMRLERSDSEHPVYRDRI